jgi:hypothetical protein
MLITSDIIREYIITQLQGSGFWEANSVLPPSSVKQFAWVQSINEIAINEKKTKLTEGNVLIAVTERFTNDSATVANVDAQARLICNKLQATAQSVFGLFKNVRIFSTDIDSGTGEIFDSPSGRVAIRNITLMYRTEQA